MSLDSGNPDKILAYAFMRLVETAAKDGVISDDEAAILDTVQLSLNYYHEALEKALEDGIITPKEEEHLQKIKDTIIASARIIAEDDSILTEDEMNLILGIMVSLKVPKKTELKNREMTEEERVVSKLLTKILF